MFGGHETEIMFVGQRDVSDKSAQISVLVEPRPTAPPIETNACCTYVRKEQALD